MPRPPPPDTALTNSGNSISAAAADQFVDRRRRRRGRQHRQPGASRRGDGACLVAGQLQHIGTGADEGDARLRRRPRPDRGSPRGTRIPGRPRRRRHAAATRMISSTDRYARTGWPVSPIWYDSSAFSRCWRVAVLVGIDRDGGDAHLVGRAERADRDLSAVGDQDFRDHPRTLTPTHWRGGQISVDQ